MRKDSKIVPTRIEEGDRLNADDRFKRGYQPKTENGEVIRPQDLTPPKVDTAVEPATQPKNDQKG